jgi:hypothetical protein
MNLLRSKVAPRGTFRKPSAASSDASQGGERNANPDKSNPEARKKKKDEADDTEIDYEIDLDKIPPFLRPFFKNIAENAEKAKKKGNNNDSDKKEGQEEPQIPSPFNTRNILIFLALPLVYRLLVEGTGGSGGSTSMAQETTFQGFLSSQAFLEGQVDHLRVSADKTRVFVYLKGSADNTDITPLKFGRPVAHAYFTIGAVDVFERQLKDAQDDALSRQDTMLQRISYDSGEERRHTLRNANDLQENSASKYGAEFNGNHKAISYIPVVYERERGPSPFWMLLEMSGTLVPLIFMGYLLRGLFRAGSGAGGTFILYIGL